MSAPTPKPAYLTIHPENIPDELIRLPQWVCWRAVWRPGKGDKSGKWTKVPYQPDGRAAKSTNPSTWTKFGHALLAYQSHSEFDGIGIVLTVGAGIVGVDLDHCLDTDGNVAPWAQRTVDILNSYSEISPSGDGLHVFVFGALRDGVAGQRKGDVEVYAEGRYLTVTGHVLGEARP